MNTGKIFQINLILIGTPYRHVVLPKEFVKLIPKTHLMSEAEWRALGVTQSQGWIHYMIHKPEPHILLFRRPITTKHPPSQVKQYESEQ